MDGMMQGGSDATSPLSPDGVDFSNQTQAADFLAQILDDTVFQVYGNRYAVYFWYCAVAVIASAALVHLVQTRILSSRIKAASRGQPSPATPKTRLANAFAALVAVAREASYPQLTLAQSRSWFKVPPLGHILLLLTYLGVILALQFSNNDVQGAQHYTALGVRASWLAVAQVPLLILLAGKNNLIGLLTGVSYERLNILHRWVSRVVLLLATLHFGYQSFGWSEYGLMQLEWQTDSCPPTGMAAYAVILWLNVSALAPIRNAYYEFFVVQHLLSFFAFIVAVMYHIPETALHARVYIWIPIGLYLTDRLIRTVRFAYHNSRPSKAVVTAINDSVTRIHITNTKIRAWAPGAFVLLSIPRFGLAQSHPATITSTPDSHNGDMVFLLKSHKGFTKRILAHAGTSRLLPRTEQDLNAEQHTCFLDGPYGGAHADFAAFDTVVLIAGSTGVTFTLSILLDLAQRATSQRLPLRSVVFLWMVKNRCSADAFVAELQLVTSALRSAGIDFSIDVRITCLDEFAGEDLSAEKDRCQCSVADSPCCCGPAPDDTDDQVKTEEVGNPTAAVTKESAAGETRKAQATIDVASTLSSTASSSLDPPQEPFVCNPGRPSFHAFLSRHLERAEGETGIAVCGPLALSMDVRNAVAVLSDERAVHKGSGAQGIYLHVEAFCL